MSNEGAVNGRLAGLLGALDGAIAAIKTNMGEAWSETVVTLITEFGRTAHVKRQRRHRPWHRNDRAHGRRGRLNGGRVIADWPGLKESDLYERRDLKATTDLRTVLKGVLKDHLRVDDSALAADVFPGSDAVDPDGGTVGLTEAFPRQQRRHGQISARWGRFRKLRTRASARLWLPASLIAH